MLPSVDSVLRNFVNCYKDSIQCFRKLCMLPHPVDIFTQKHLVPSAQLVKQSSQNDLFRHLLVFTCSTLLILHSAAHSVVALQITLQVNYSHRNIPINSNKRKGEFPENHEENLKFHTYFSNTLFYSFQILNFQIMVRVPNSLQLSCNMVNQKKSQMSTIRTEQIQS